MRLVLDADVLVSGLLFPGGPPSRLVKAWRAGAFDLVISDFVIDELARTWAQLAPRLKASTDDLASGLTARQARSETGDDGVRCPSAPGPQPVTSMHRKYVAVCR